MTDRELLELAAKAAGLDVRWYANDCLQVADKCNGFAGKWNPLTDDGDALRLAVKLRLTIEVDFDRVDVNDLNRNVVATEYLYEMPKPTDPYAATRLAIVRAAAEIGKGME